MIDPAASPLIDTAAPAEDQIAIPGRGYITAIDPPMPDGNRVFTLSNAQCTRRWLELPESYGGMEGTAKVGEFGTAWGWPETLSYADAVCNELEAVERPTIDMMPISMAAPGAVSAWQSICEAMATHIKTDALKEMIDAVFCDASIYERFVTSPGSKQTHHAFVGGLAVHTAAGLSVGLGFPAAQFSNEESREVLLATFLLHDVAKVHLYGQQGYAIYEVGHELRLMSMIGEHFARFRSRQRHMAEFMLLLLDPKLRVPDSPTPEIHMLAAMDRVTASKSLSAAHFAAVASTRAIAYAELGGRRRPVYRAKRR